MKRAALTSDACGSHFLIAVHFECRRLKDVGARVEFADYLSMLPQDRRAALDARIARATAHGSSELVFPKLIEQTGGQPRIRRDWPGAKLSSS